MAGTQGRQRNGSGTGATGADGLILLPETRIDFIQIAPEAD
ncbi:hypothetical protein [Bifidobacterium longum]|nr:hypothetical protein [Bifidobacterium longum]